jgi:HK97 family phage portal protein
MFSRSVNNPNIPLSQALDNECLANALGVGSNDAGVVVNNRTALQYSVVWKAHNLISGDVAKLPLNVFRRNGKGKDKDPRHAAFNLLRWKPNECMTAYDFWKGLMCHALGGNGYAFIERNQAGRPIGLHLLDPNKVTPFRVTTEDGGQRMHYKHTAQAAAIDGRDMLHIKGMGYDGIQGYSVISFANRSIGEALATQIHSATYFKNNATPGVILETDQALDPEAIKRLKQSWDAAFQGVKKGSRTAVLEHGLKVSTAAINARDSQLVESKTHSIRDVANWYNIPPHKLGDTARTSYSSLEQENQSYLDEALDGWLVNIEQECRDKLLTAQQKNTDSHVIEFNRAALVRADMSARGEFFAKALGGAPWMTRDEVRGIDNLNPLPGGVGDSIIDPLNMAGTQEPQEPQEPEDDTRMVLAHRDAIQAAAQRVIVRGARMVEQRGESAQEWLEGEIVEDLKAHAWENITPALRAYSASVGKHLDERAETVELLHTMRQAFGGGDKVDPEEMARDFSNNMTLWKE